MLSTRDQSPKRRMGRDAGAPYSIFTHLIGQKLQDAIERHGPYEGLFGNKKANKAARQYIQTLVDMENEKLPIEEIILKVWNDVMGKNTNNLTITLRRYLAMGLTEYYELRPYSLNLLYENKKHPADSIERLQKQRGNHRSIHWDADYGQQLAEFKSLLLNNLESINEINHAHNRLELVAEQPATSQPSTRCLVM